MLIGRLRHKAVLRRASQIQQTFVRPVRSCFTRVPVHHVRVHIHGVHRVRHSHHVVVSEDVKNIPRIALRPIRYVNFIRFHLHPALSIRHLRYLLTQPIIPLLRTVPVEGLSYRLVVNSLVHRLNGDLRQWLRHVPYSAANDVSRLVGMLCRIRRYPTSYLGE